MSPVDAEASRTATVELCGVTVARATGDPGTVVVLGSVGMVGSVGSVGGVPSAANTSTKVVALDVAPSSSSTFSSTTSPPIAQASGTSVTVGVLNVT